MAEYKLGKYTFTTEEEYTAAKEDIAFINAVKSKYDLHDEKVKGIILSKYKPKSSIGRDFVNSIKGDKKETAQKPAPSSIKEDDADSDEDDETHEDDNTSGGNKLKTGIRNGLIAFGVVMGIGAVVFAIAIFLAKHSPQPAPVQPTAYAPNAGNSPMYPNNTYSSTPAQSTAGSTYTTSQPDAEGYKKYVLENLEQTADIYREQGFKMHTDITIDEKSLITNIIFDDFDQFATLYYNLLKDMSDYEYVRDGIGVLNMFYLRDAKKYGFEDIDVMSSMSFVDANNEEKILFTYMDSLLLYDPASGISEPDMDIMNKIKDSRIKETLWNQ